MSVRQIYFNFCTWTAVSAGTGDFVVNAAVASDRAGNHDVPANCVARNGAVYHYEAQSSDGSQTENGLGTWNTAGNKLVRTTILFNSNGDTNPVNFATAPVVDVFPQPGPSLDTSVVIPSGTLMLFQQTSAPTGWTKQTTHNDKTLRVVSGTASSGGSNAFSTVMAQTVVGNHTLTIAEMPSHSHPITTTDISCGGVSDAAHSGVGTSTFTDNTQTTGGGGAHNHTITMNIQYVDLIIAQKN